MTEREMIREKATSACSPGDPHRAWDWPQGTDWNSATDCLFANAPIQDLEAFVGKRRQLGPVFPAPENVFRSLRVTPLAKVTFVILGQDPYHGVGQAQGLSFSVPPGVKHPPSLRNILREYAEDTGHNVPESGDLTAWARRGGLLLNSVLTVDAHQAHSHRRQGWEEVTDNVISLVNAHVQNVAFVLWGKPAQEKRALIDGQKHLIIEAPHPSPLSAHRGFFGSRPFSKINEWRAGRGLSEIDWRLD